MGSGGQSRNFPSVSGLSQGLKAKREEASLTVQCFKHLS